MANPNPPPLAYQEETADTYGDTFAASCTATEIRRGVLLVGTCPRCGDPMQFPVVTSTVKSTTGAGPAPPTAEDTPLLCTCRTDHPGRPDGEEGCGAYWNVRIPRPGS